MGGGGDALGCNIFHCVAVGPQGHGAANYFDRWLLQLRKQKQLRSGKYCGLGEELNLFFKEKKSYNWNFTPRLPICTWLKTIESTLSPF